jgi:RHS repeat-associated protein
VRKDRGHGRTNGGCQEDRQRASIRVKRLSALLLAAACLASAALAAGAIGATDPVEPDQPSKAPAPPTGPELLAKRTANSETFALPGGERETRIYEAAINYRDADGDWQPIEEGLEPGPGASIVNGDNRFDVHLPPNLGAAPVRVTSGDSWVGYRLRGLESEVGELEGGAAVYDGAQDGTQFEFTTLSNGLKESIEIADASQPHSFSFELSASPGVAPQLLKDGSIEFRDEAGDLMATLPAPTVADSDPTHIAPPDAVSYELRDEAGAWILDVNVDPDWLAAEDRAWPVTIDPTVLSFSSPFFACNLHTAPNQYLTQCQSQGMQTIYATALGEYKVRSAIFFNTNGVLPTGAPVTSATIGLNAVSASFNTVGVKLRPILQPWNEASVSWMRSGYPTGISLWTTPGGTAEASGPEILTSQRGNQAGWWNFDVWSMAQRWVEGTLPSYGVLAQQSDEGCYTNPCPHRQVEWASGAWPTPSERPYLKITYIPKAPVTSKVVSPSEGTRTARRLKLKSAWTTAGAQAITYQWKPTGEGTPGKNTWQTIPPSLVKKASGAAVSAWPLALTTKEKEDRKTAPVYFDARSASEKAERDGESIYVRAVFEGTSGSGGSEGYTDGVSAVVDPAKGNVKDATVQVGPGMLDLATGNFKLSATDVSIPGPGGALEFSRTAESREDISFGSPPKGIDGVLGAGWKPTVPVEEAGGAAWRGARDETVEEGGSYTVVTDLEGAELPFEWNGSAYVTPEEMPGWVLSRQSASQITLRDASGGSTVFEKNPTGSEYLPVSVSTLGGSGNKTQFVYELVGGKKRLARLIAPSAAGVSCNPETAHGEAGCRVLSFYYQSATTWGAPASYGDRLASIYYWGPAAGYEDRWPVALYEYNKQGRLSQVWDPRISPALKTGYDYADGGLGPVETVRPPAQYPWNMKYTQRSEEVENPGGGTVRKSRKGWWRLESVNRYSLLEKGITDPDAYANTTIAYDVPVSGSGAPYDLSGATVAKWAQEDIPTDATAVFPPDEVPSSSPPSAYTRATVYYMDAEGNLVNTATPKGAGTEAASISTAETDEHGNVYRELTPQNRLRALASGSSTAETAAKAKELDTHRRYSPDGTQMEEEWGPTHETRFADGTTAPARLHRAVQYDEGAPTLLPPGTPKPNLPTLETTGAEWEGGVDKDRRMMRTTYDWSLRKPTDAIVDPGGLEIHHRVTYDATTGAPTLMRQPKSSGSGADPYTTEVIYYSGLFSAPYREECSFKPELAGLPCLSAPAKQPETAGAPEVPATFFVAYNSLGQPTEVRERTGTNPLNWKTLRTTKIEYDAAGRQTAKWQEGGGVALPRTATTYYESTGLPEKTRFFCPTGNTPCEAAYKGEYATTTTYDALGRATAYQDGDGNVSTAAYDLLGRPVTIGDGKGTQTLKYDSVTGLLVELEDPAAGTFTAAYDADGNMTERSLPNGLTATTTYDPVGAPTHLTYTKASNCGASCTWLDFSSERSINGQVLAQASNLSSQQYSYDKVGRLTFTKDTPQGGGCTTRSYKFDADSNRTELTTRSPGIAGACAESGGTVQTYKYDEADRLIGSGIIYDTLGRITELPGGYSGGGTLKTSYFTNEMVAQQEQDGVVNKYLLDAAGRQRFRESTEAGGKQESFHYGGPGDTVAWSQTGASSFSRYVTGINGELAAIADTSGSSTTVELQLTDLHGDIVATASLESSVSSLLSTFGFDEYGNPKQSGLRRFGWLGGKARRTELKSGVIQMGVRSYVPALGRFLSPDPIMGGSANSYDYAEADPVGRSDLTGLRSQKKDLERGGRITRSTKEKVLRIENNTPNEKVAKARIQAAIKKMFTRLNTIFRRNPTWRQPCRSGFDQRVRESKQKGFPAGLTAWEGINGCETGVGRKLSKELEQEAEEGKKKAEETAKELEEAGEKVHL